MLVRISAENSKTRIEKEGRQCLLVPGDLMKDADCKKTVDEHVKKYGQCDESYSLSSLRCSHKCT